MRKPLKEKSMNGVRVGSMLLRKAGGQCLLTQLTLDTATVKWPSGKTTTMPLENLRKFYEPK